MSTSKDEKPAEYLDVLSVIIHSSDSFFICDTFAKKH